MFKDRLRQARKNRGLTQLDLGQAIGVAKSTVTSYEMGNSEPDIARLEKIMATLGIDANYLFQDEMSKLITNADHKECANDEQALRMSVSDLISTRRQILGLTYEEIGNAVGVSKSTVRKWEKGMIKNMRRDKIAALAKVLQVSPSALIEREEFSQEAIEVAAAYEEADLPTRNAVRRVLELPCVAIKPVSSTHVKRPAVNSPLDYFPDGIELTAAAHLPEGVSETDVFEEESDEPC